MGVKRTRNGGFSLIELAVTVMLMSILAVALAPQVMKWVNNARLATDSQTRNSVVGFTQNALTNMEAYTQANGIVTQIVIDNDTCLVSGINGDAPAPVDKIAAAVAENGGLTSSSSGYDATISGLRTKTTGGQIIVTIQSGVVSSAMFGYDDTASAELGLENITVSSPAIISEITGTVRGAAIGSGGGTVAPGSNRSPVKPTHPQSDISSLFTGPDSNGQYYIDNNLVVRTAEDIASIAVSAGDAPVWVYVGLDELLAGGSGENLVLYKWDGTVNENNQPIWVKMHTNGIGR